MLRPVVIFLLCAIVGVQGTCPPDYAQFPAGTSPCYSLKSNDGGELDVTWEQAADWCIRDGGNLASIKSLGSQVLLNVLLKGSADMSEYDGVWIGLSDKVTNGVYLWPDGNNTDSFTNWAPGHPDFSIPAGERCIQMHADDQTPGLWKTYKCNEATTLNFICEKNPIDNNAPVPAPCSVGSDPDYFEFDGACFKISSDKVAAADAEAACQATAPTAHLATVSNAYHNNALRLLMLVESQTSAWIGLGSYQGLFTWTDRSQLITYTNWAAQEPQPSDTKACVSTDGVMWTTEDCSVNKTAICTISLGTGPDRPVRGECPTGWSPLGTDCVQYISEAKTAPEALQHCNTLYNGASLFAPHTVPSVDWDEFGITPGTQFWLAMRRNDDDIYKMADGSPIDYVNWADGQPCCWNSVDDCTVGNVVFQSSTFEMSGFNCSEQKPFFCVIRSLTGPPENGFCLPNWVKLGRKCYTFFPEELTYAEAKSSCEGKALGGDLAGISTGSLQDMVVYFMRSYTRNIWIGLWDTTNNKQFRWTNGDPVTFTNWAPGQPDGYLDFFDDTESKNDCVMMIADPVVPGLWDDISCGEESRLPYVCEAYIDPTQSAPPISSNCPPGFVEDFYGLCYRPVADVNTYEDALATCEGFGVDASLASIADGYEQGLVQYYMSNFDDAPESLWIGINDRENVGEYVNTDGTPVNYVNWFGMDSPKGGTCVASQRGGKWLESNCTEERAALCKVRPTIPATPSPGVTHCDDDWIQYDGNGLCYLINTYRLPDDLTDSEFVSYADATRLCKSQGATLVSIHNRAESDWLYKVSRVTLGQRNIWLGLHRSNEGLLQWEDGSVVNFVFWDTDEPSSGQEGTDCVSFFAGNDGMGLWRDDNCFKLNAFICQKPANEGPKSKCEEGWDDAGSNCFYFSSAEEEGRTSWDEAEMSCLKMGSHLASLDNEFERRNLSNILRNKYPSTVANWPWIGFRREPNDADFTWSDGTPTSSDPRTTAWSQGQPDSDDDDCAVIEISEGYYELWNDINCGLKRPFICKKAPDSPGLPTPGTTEVPPGGCTSGGTRVGNHCYRLDTDPQSWDAARGVCAGFPNGDLASIPIYAVQVLTSALLNLVQVDNIWLGMSSRVPNNGFPRAFHWIDGIPLTFTNWGSGQPSLPTDEEYCVKMLTDPDAPGKWYDDDCSKEYSFLCKYDLDPDSPIVPPATFAPCPSGFTGSAPSCFRVETVERTFSNAVQRCKSVGGILAPIMDGYENAYTELLMYNSDIESAWVGLSSESTGTYDWVDDQWPKNYLNWAGQEPTLEEGCAVSVYSEGWRSIDCQANARPSICRSNQDTPPTPPPDDPSLDCPEGWYEFNKDCHLISTGFASDNLLNAYFQCATIGGVPPSIHSRDENNFIRMNALQELGGKFVWIGLVTQEGSYSWIDASVVDFTYWADGEEMVPDDGKECVLMDLELDGKWLRKECNEQAEVVCMLYTRNIPTATTGLMEPTGDPVTEIPPVLSTGAIVGISVGGGALILLLVIWVCYYCEKQANYRKEWQQRMQNSNIDPDYGIENVQYSQDIELRKKKQAQTKKSDDAASESSSSSGGYEERF